MEHVDQFEIIYQNQVGVKVADDIYSNYIDLGPCFTHQDFKHDVVKSVVTYWNKKIYI